jgi:hypothetical protein
MERMGVQKRMRLVEKCSCGASIELAWNEPKSSYNHEAMRESERAAKEITAFRKNHKPCRDKGVS